MTSDGHIELHNGAPTWSEELEGAELPFVRASSGGGSVCAVRVDGRLQCGGSMEDVP